MHVQHASIYFDRSVTWSIVIIRQRWVVSTMVLENVSLCAQIQILWWKVACKNGIGSSSVCVCNRIWVTISLTDPALWISSVPTFSDWNRKCSVVCTRCFIIGSSRAFDELGICRGLWLSPRSKDTHRQLSSAIHRRLWALVTHAHTPV